MKYNILAIEREFASGGREIGTRVAQMLEIPYYNREILKIAAEQYETSPEYLEHLEETATNSFLYSLYLMSMETTLKGNGLSSADALYLAEANIIASIAANGSAVIVGRCATHVLRGRKDVLNVFIHAELDSRMERAVEVYGIEYAQAEAHIRKNDKRRANYFNANTNKKWNDSTNYHLMLDSGKLGVEDCAAILATCMKGGGMA